MKKPTIDTLDVVMTTGAGLIVFGTWQIYRPAGLIIAGLFLLALGAARIASKRKVD